MVPGGAWCSTVTLTCAAADTAAAQIGGHADDKAICHVRLSAHNTKDDARQRVLDDMRIPLILM